MFLIVEPDAALLACFATGLKILNGVEFDRALPVPSSKITHHLHSIFILKDQIPIRRAYVEKRYLPWLFIGRKYIVAFAGRLGRN